MCANDIVVSGAEPLFFLDYYATGKLDVDVAADVIQGIAEGCRQAGAALVGGETAEMPGMYAPGDYDLAGFCVGIVEKSRIIDGSRVSPGDVLIGLSSSGPHSNGYSLIRRILAVSKAELADTLDGGTLGHQLLAPTRIYVKPVLALLEQIEVRALSHITGGGLLENLPRVLPTGCRALVRTASWTRPVIFDLLQAQGRIDGIEMHRTFNCGIGMVLVVAAADVDACLGHLRGQGEEAWVIGSVESGQGEAHVELLTD
jgi:phosphoribosylformylglycinamidine cyclo-ligase